MKNEIYVKNFLNESSGFFEENVKYASRKLSNDFINEFLEKANGLQYLSDFSELLQHFNLRYQNIAKIINKKLDADVLKKDGFKNNLIKINSEFENLFLKT